MRLDKVALVIKNYYLLESESIFTANIDSSYPYWKEAAWSVVLPGWGQIRKKHYFTAIFLGLLLIASAGYYKSRLDAFSVEKSKYDETVLMGILYQQTKIPIGGMYGLISSENQFQKVESASASIGPASILIGAIYALNILDALLWKTSLDSSKKEVSFHFYTKIQMNHVANSNLTATPQSASSLVEFGLRFSF